MCSVQPSNGAVLSDLGTRFKVIPGEDPVKNLPRAILALAEVCDQLTVMFSPQIHS